MLMHPLGEMSVRNPQRANTWKPFSQHHPNSLLRCLFWAYSQCPLCGPPSFMQAIYYTAMHQQMTAHTYTAYHVAFSLNHTIPHLFEPCCVLPQASLSILCQSEVDNFSNVSQKQCCITLLWICVLECFQILNGVPCCTLVRSSHFSILK